MNLKNLQKIFPSVKLLVFNPNTKLSKENNVGIDNFNTFQYKPSNRPNSCDVQTIYVSITTAYSLYRIFDSSSETQPNKKTKKKTPLIKYNPESIFQQSRNHVPYIVLSPVRLLLYSLFRNVKKKATNFPFALTRYTLE